MYHRIRTLAAAVTLAAGLTVIPATTGAAHAAKADTYCRVRRTHAQPVRFTYFTETASARVYYNQCWYRSNPSSWWVAPNYLRFRVRRYAFYHHQSESCNPLNPYTGTTFQAYIWNSQTGADWSGKKHKLGCASDGEAVLTLTFKHRYRFHNTNGVWPRWKVNVTQNLGLTIPDKHGIVHGYLR